MSTTPDITPIPSLPPNDDRVVNIDQIMMDMPLPENVPLPQAQEPTRKKRTYRHVTQADRNLLKEKWTEHGNEWSAQEYSQVTGIKLTMVRSLLTALRKGNSIDLVSTTHGRRHLINYDIAQTMVERIQEDNQVTIKQICSRVYKKHHVKVSESTVSRFFSSERIMDMGLGVYTIKRVVNRAPTANSPEIKEMRKQSVVMHHNYIRDGYIATFVDESSIQLSSVRNYGWAPRGERAFAYRSQRYIGLTSITIISQYGVEYSQIVKGSVTREIFKAAIQTFIADQASKNVNRMFVMDNASIHGGDLKEMIEQAGHKLVYNAPHTSIMNPIEMVFGFWKSRCISTLNRETDIDTIIRILSEALAGITVGEISCCIEHVKNVV